jgi:translocation and assembly module TamB
MVRHLWAALAVLLCGLGAPVLAQQAAEEDDAGFLARQLQNVLSGEGREVRIEGFEGALSATARIGRITFADRAGVWLVVEDATMNWNRAALLRGAVSVNQLTAQRITLSRLPEPDPAAPPDAGTQGFALPELPVAVEIGRIDVRRVELAEPVVGMAADLALTGQLALLDGTALVRLRAERLDGPDGLISVAADLDPGNDLLALEIVAREQAGGLVASLAGIPGAPALDLTVTSDGPLSDFAADIALDVDGTELLAGRATITREAVNIAPAGQPVAAAPGPQPWRITADVGGDLGPLLGDDIRPFFGDRADLRLDALRRPDGALDLDLFTLRTRVLYLDASGGLGADGFPDRLLVRGLLRDLRGGPVLLPVAGAAPLRLDGALLRGEYDAAAGDGWQAVLNLDGLDQAERALGELRLRASGTLTRGDGPEGIGALAGTIAATARGIATGDAALDAALGGSLSVQGGLGWSEGAPLQFVDLTLDGADFRVILDGDLAEPGAGGRFTGSLQARASDLARFSALAGRDLGGALGARAAGRVDILGGGFDLDLSASARRLQTGDPGLDRLLGGAVAFSGKARRDATGLTLDDVALDAGGISAEGRAALSGPGQALVGEGAATLRIADLSGLSGLGGRPLGGAVQASLEGRAAFDLSTFDVEAAIDGSDLRTGDPALDRIAGGPLTARLSAARTAEAIALRRFELTARGLTAEASGEAAGTLDNLAVNGTATARIADLSGLSGLLGRSLAGAVDARVAGAATLDLVRFDPAVTLAGAPLALDAQLVTAGLSTGDAGFDAVIGGSGRITVAAERRDEVLHLDTFAVDLAGLSANASGTVAGPAETAELQGTARVAMSDLSALNALTGRNLAGSLAATASGSVALNAQRFDVQASADIRALRTGIAPVDRIAGGDGRLRLDATRQDAAIELRALSLDLPGASLQASGTLSGAGGTIALDARLANLGTFVPELPGAVTASGTIGQRADGTLDIDLAGRGPGGIATELSGSYDLAGNRADLRATGAATLALANVAVDPRSIALRGPLRFDLRLAGQPAIDSLSGSVTIQGGTAVIPAIPMRLEAITATLRLDRGTLSVEAGSRIAAGGRIAVNGTIRLDPAAGIPGNITATLQGATLRERGLYEALLSGTVGMDGRLAGGAIIAGRITIDRAELTVAPPPPGGGAIAEIVHRNETAAERTTRRRAGLIADDPGDGSGAGGARSGGVAYPLDVTISAPARIFVRGRGLDAELGGSIQIRGTTAAPSPTGSFQLIRGRLNLLAKRLNLREARVTLLGDLDPDIYVLAQSESDNGVTVFIRIAGSATEPRVDFYSDPDLPEDEVLAELFFGTPVSELSALQVAQLAAAINELSGRGGDGILNRLREATGVDDIDIETDSDGTVTARAGKYVSENVYTSLGVTGEGTTELQLNLEVAPGIVARGSVTSDSESSIGVFFERDY